MIEGGGGRGLIFLMYQRSEFILKMECVTQEEFLCMFHVVFNSTMSNESFFCAVLLINVCDVSGSEDFQEKQNIILQASIIIILVILAIIILHASIHHHHLRHHQQQQCHQQEVKKIFIIQASTIQRQICEIQMFHSKQRSLEKGRFENQMNS